VYISIPNSVTPLMKNMYVCMYFEYIHNILFDMLSLFISWLTSNWVVWKGSIHLVKWGCMLVQTVPTISAG
jgi:cellulose synthase/poly-beta-1,6-N-acetylglucosamine synthase-like glycosyltransferase